MKKFYSLVAIVAATVAISAQGTETFENANLPSSYGDGTFDGETPGVTVNYVHSRDEATFGITGKGIMLRRSDDSSSVEFVIPNGVGTFTFEYRKAYAGGSTRQLEIFVNGVSVATTDEFGSGNGAQTNVYSHTVTVNQQGNVSVKIAIPTSLRNNRQTTIDNVSWTAYDPSLSTVDFSKSKLSLVKYTQVSDVVEFAKASEVKIYNMSGQIVKEVQVTANEKLSVADLLPGMYIVTGVVNGEKVSQKVLKK